MLNFCSRLRRSTRFAVFKWHSPIMKYKKKGGLVLGAQLLCGAWWIIAKLVLANQHAGPRTRLVKRFLKNILINLVPEKIWMTYHPFSSFFPDAHTLCSSAPTTAKVLGPGNFQYCSIASLFNWADCVALVNWRGSGAHMFGLCPRSY